MAFSQSKVLIVDDDLTARTTLEAILSVENYTLYLAENGMQALKLAAEVQPDIILLDVIMPGISGFDTCKAIRAMPGLGEIPIVLVTSLDEREARLAGLKAGADDFLTKPFDHNELKARVLNLTSLNRYRQQTIYNSLELKFYETFISDQVSQNDQNTIQLNALRNISDYVEAEEAVFVLFDFENPELATKKLLGPQTTWKAEDTFLLKRSPLCNAMPQTVSMLDYRLHSISEADPVFNDIVRGVIRNVLLAPLNVNQSLLGAMLFVNPLLNLKSDDRRTRFLQLMVRGVANAIFAQEHNRQLMVSKAELEASQWEILNSRNTLRTFFDNIPTCVYIIDRSYTIVAINSRRSERVGKSPTELVGGKCYEKLFGNSSPCALCRVADAFKGVPAVRSLREWGPKETFIHWEITTVPIRENQDVISRAIVFDEDITEKWILEANLIESEKLASIGQLAANVAHEINNPLAAIIANAQLLLRDLPEADEDTVEALKLIETAGVRAAKIVGNLLDSARREKRDEFDEFSLNETITDALTMVNYEIKHRSIQVKLDLAEDLPQIFAHKNQLKGVWINLIVNALGAVETSKGVISISTRYDRQEYHVVITDNGQGISPEHQEHIFEPFFTTKEVGKGTGLGLSVSLQVIKNHHGTIHFETKPGKGTKFIIILPDTERNES